MRLLAGASELERADGATVAGGGWVRVEAGAWLGQTLAGLRGPEGLARADPGPDLHGTLRPYQKTGVSWLGVCSSIKPCACPDDDMGLGKTIHGVWVIVLF